MIEVMGGIVFHQDVKILHAAMAAMVAETHVCQDNLTQEEWDRAEELFKELDNYLNEV